MLIEKIKLLIGITDDSKDELLNLLLEQAEEEAVNYTHNEDIVDEAVNIIIQMVLHKYNRLSTMGVDSESYSGNSFHYSTDYTDAIYKSLKAHRKVMVV